MIAQLGTTEITVASPGIFDGLSRAAYEAIDAINISRLKYFAKTPAHARYYLSFPPKPTDALNMGDACHAAILEPERFEAEFIAGLPHGRRSTADKLAWKAFEDAHHNQIVLPHEDYAACLAMRDALWTRESVAKSIVSASGRNERSFVWRDGETQTLCKGRLDRMVRWNGYTVVLDLKTSRSAAPDDFARDVAKYHYAEQAAFYLDGLYTLAPVQRRWIWLVMEKEPPYLVALYEPEDRLLDQGRRTYRKWLREYTRCLETDTWTGYDDGIVPLDVPRWFQKNDEFVFAEAV